jgi:hypothetical protein
MNKKWTNPDQYLPPDYVEAPEYVREDEKGYVECTCANALTYSNCSKKCKRILADEIEPKDKFLEWIEHKIELTREDNSLQREHWAFCKAYEKYKELNSL